MLWGGMARPKEFDRDEALTVAIGVFADRGYEGASTDRLLKAMGLNRQSLYDTYGSKRQLYLEALHRYNRDSASRIVADLAAGPTPLAGIERMLLSFIEAATGQADPACLGTGAICEFGLRDAGVVAAGSASHGALAEALTSALQQGQGAGEIGADIDLETAADFLLGTLTGLKVGARGGMSRDRLRRMANLALCALRAEPSSDQV